MFMIKRETLLVQKELPTMTTQNISVIGLKLIQKTYQTNTSDI